MPEMVWYIFLFKPVIPSWVLLSSFLFFSSSAVLHGHIDCYLQLLCIFQEEICVLDFDISSLKLHLPHLMCLFLSFCPLLSIVTSFSGVIWLGALQT